LGCTLLTWPAAEPAKGMTSVANGAPPLSATAQLAFAVLIGPCRQHE
jgi:hypothetical protein